MEYITYGELQEHMREYYKRTGHGILYPEIIYRLKQKGLLHEQMSRVKIPEEYEKLEEEEFDKIIDRLSIPADYGENVSSSAEVEEGDFFPAAKDVFAIRHLRYTRPCAHKHDYFEINYVAKGLAVFMFEKEKHIMKEGEICIIAPSSLHDFYITDESSVYTISIRVSTFNKTFFSLMSRKDLLSYFFRTILREKQYANYLMFFTKNNKELQQYMRHMIVESSRYDPYSNTFCISYVYLMFAYLLRNYSETLEYYDYKMGSDFSLVLQYIQHNYQNITLVSLAEFFNYSEPYLCMLIKKNTGYTFTELVKQLRLSAAEDYLCNTDMKIGEIAENIGYHSADHFSRVFRNEYKISPQQYRQKYRII